MKNGTFIFSLFLLLLSFIPEANSKFVQEKKTETSLQHEATVSLKLVQVFVTDKDGNPVMDLKKSDFELYEDGKLRTITSWSIEYSPAKKNKERMFFSWSCRCLYCCLTAIIWNSA